MAQKTNTAYLGLNLDSIISQVKPGQLTYAQNAQVFGFDGNSITYQNEQANQLCFNLPTGYQVIGTYNIVEEEIIIYWLVNPSTGASEIGKVTNCVYSTVINAPCLNFHLRYPILKAVHKKTACGLEVYWTDNRNPRRYIDLNNLPFKEIVQGDSDSPCDIVTTSEIDCNKLSIQPNFSIPQIYYTEVNSEGTMLAGTYQFAIQYSNSVGDAYTSYYSVTNPIPIYDFFKITPDFNYEVAKSIILRINEIDTTGIYDSFNLAVIKTINNISSVDLVGTFQIQSSEQTIVYTGQSKEGITLSINDIFEKFPIYDKAGDITTLQDVLVWADLTTTQRISYQKIASQIKPQWVTWKLPPSKKQFKDEINSAELRGYMRDEVYAFDMVIEYTNGYQTDRFPLIGREPTAFDLEYINNSDSRFEEEACDEITPKPRWKVYNTASVLGTDPGFIDDDCYEGPYQYGEFAYWESTETYPCNEEVWGDLQGKPIRHFKFPDNIITNHHDDQGNIYPIGIRIDIRQIYDLIRNSDLSEDEKNRIANVKIVRANRANAKSVKAKGLLFNVGKYSRGTSDYFYPNYPFNDLRPDPFILNNSNNSIGDQINSSFEEQQSIGNNSETTLYSFEIAPNTWTNDGDIVTANYNGKFAGTSTKRLRIYIDGNVIYDSGSISVDSTNSFILTSEIKRANSSRIDVKNRLQILGTDARTINTTSFLNGFDPSVSHTITMTATATLFPPQSASDGDVTTTSAEIGYKKAPVVGTDDSLDGFSGNDSRKRFTFHSPDTSFFQPLLGNILKLEVAEYGLTRSHFVQVKNHAKYRFPSLESYLTSLAVGMVVGFASGTYGFSTNPFNGAAAFTAFSVFNDIVFRLLPKKNMAYQFNSVGNYSRFKPVPNDTGNKIRTIDIGTYLISGMQGVGDTEIINNYQRESSVYLRTTETLPVPSSIAGVPEDNSRFTLSQVGCNDIDIFTRDVSSYYASIKTEALDQYGHIYSYQAIDTGYKISIDVSKEFEGDTIMDVFGGDTFINKFAFKRKLPFFIDNRVGFPDESDVFYDELGNIGFPKYWFSTDIRRGDGGAFGIGALFGVKVNNFDCENNAFFYNAGKIYLFAYGIVNFFVESAVNVDYRQAYNALEGDYYPRVGSDIPDDWLQETNVSINFDNTYTYNKTYSKQNTENVFTTLPVDFISDNTCTQNFPNRIIFSEVQQDVVNYNKNNWRIYRPVSLFDFPLNYGKLTSVDGIETRQILARFENKTMLYNSLLTVNASIGDVYLGQSIFNKNIPPVDFAETDLGYTGSQHKFMLRTEFGHVWIDAKRGDIFLMQGQSLNDISNEGVKLFLTNNLNFKIQEAFPNYDIDNSFKGIGICGVYDNRYHRLIFTKLDYKPLMDDIVYNNVTDTFSLNGSTIELSDTNYFCDVSFTISYSFVSKSWTSFHSYLPRFYVGDLNKFHTGNETSIWTHNINETSYNNFYGNIEPYILEYPIAYQGHDEILQSIRDYTKVNRITNTSSFVQTNTDFFNKAIIYNDQQCSGTINLIPKPKNNLSAYLTYPKYNIDSRDVLFVKSDNFYNYNGFWDIVKNHDEPIWLPDCTSNSENKVLNTSNLEYLNRSYKKYPIRAKDCRVRHILDDKSTVRLTSQFISSESQISYK